MKKVMKKVVKKGTKKGTTKGMKKGMKQAQKKEASARTTRTGISNRESADEEARERRMHPPIEAGAPPAEDASGRVGDPEPASEGPRQTSHKAGSRSVAQKEAGSRYPDRSMPSSHKVAGAFGKEPGNPFSHHLTTPEKAAVRKPETHLPTRGRARQGETRHKAKQRSA
jgi:hypothetical protein